MDDRNPFASDHGMEQAFPPADEPAIEAPPKIGADERRMHVRAYNYWVSLLDGRPYPSIDDLDPDALDFGANSVLLDFTGGPENAAIPYLGAALRAEGGLTASIHSIADVPPRSVLSRLTDHYLEILANRAPIGFEAEYVSHRGMPTMYRGILMPFTSNGDEIDFIYGVVNWKDVEVEVDDEVRRAVETVLSEPPAAHPATPVWADGPLGQPRPEDLARFGAPALDPLVFETEGMVAQGSALYDRLAIARESAEALQFSDQRTRAALYAALGQAYDFALAAEIDPDIYAEILEDAGLKTQARAPMTPLVKLIFGATYDKTRLAEYSTALSFAFRHGLAAGALPAYLDNYHGGLKAVVRAERQLRRPATVDHEAEARRALASMPALARLSIAGTRGDFVTLIARREADGSLAVLAATEADARQIVRSAKLQKIKHATPEN